MNNGIIDTDELSRQLSKLGGQIEGGVAERERLESTGIEGAKRGRAPSFTWCVRMFSLFVKSDRSTLHSQAVRRRNTQVCRVFDGTAAGCRSAGRENVGSYAQPPSEPPNLTALLFPQTLNEDDNRSHLIGLILRLSCPRKVCKPVLGT